MPTAALRLAAAALIAGLSLDATAATTYASQQAFLAAVGAWLTDDYESPLYALPDAPDGTLNDAHMSAVRGETTYRTTGLLQHNIVESQASDALYCGGCNGSFELGFTHTSVGTSNGVYGVGLNVVANKLVVPYVAFVTYGDGTTENVTLPVRDFQTPGPATLYWGLTSPKLIRSIHFGLAGGGSIKLGGFAIDNLTIGGPPGADTDGDGIPDNNDNCIEAANPSQADSDGDGYGNRCDGDLDNSGFVTFADLALFRAAFGTPNANADFDGSGIVNFADLAIFRTLFAKPPGPSGVAH